MKRPEVVGSRNENEDENGPENNHFDRHGAAFFQENSFDHFHQDQNRSQWPKDLQNGAIIALLGTTSKHYRRFTASVLHEFFADHNLQYML